jgi:sec-independent protein translocase protein TatA
MLAELGLKEILVIILVIIVLFGSKRIPETAGAFGKMIRGFKRGVRGDAP